MDIEGALRRPRGLAAAVLVLLAFGLLVGAMAGLGAADEEYEAPAHPHMLVQRPEFGMADGTFSVLGWRKCVDLAGGHTVPSQAHHEHVHTGKAGEQLYTDAGHVVVPGSPITPWANCAALEAALPIPLE